MAQRLPAIQRAPLSTEQRQHLAGMREMIAEGHVRRAQQAAEREAADERKWANEQAAYEIHERMTRRF